VEFSPKETIYLQPDAPFAGPNNDDLQLRFPVRIRAVSFNTLSRQLQSEPLPVRALRAQAVPSLRATVLVSLERRFATVYSNGALNLSHIDFIGSHGPLGRSLLSVAALPVRV
jgi:hypothetical protein